MKRSNNFKTAIDRSKLSKAEIGRRMGLSRQAVSNWWDGKSKPNDLPKFAKIVGVPLNDLLDSEDVLNKQTFVNNAKADNLTSTTTISVQGERMPVALVNVDDSQNLHIIRAIDVLNSYNDYKSPIKCLDKAIAILIEAKAELMIQQEAEAVILEPLDT